MPVLDTAALLHWPAERLEGCLVVFSQQDELRRLDESKWLFIESLGLDWRQVNPAEAIEAATKTGDISGLSQVDLDVLALAIQTKELLYTDDYRMQNVCRFLGLAFSGVVNKESASYWQWVLVCTGCRKTTEVEHQKNPDCDICGSPTKVKKKRISKS
ncbi:MAG: hypothetical protein CMA25_03690 [Euryarchaeota archaeon]|mgnify:FL=1|nr:hypothetical protein [Euryarchaeota archaeon]|tara:strand:- start:360 stop:833 length:474 start_codon:yes stop_codon:yes gene_type:complete